MTALEIDHVVLGVPDLDDAARRLEQDHGLLALPGGRHPGWGTANRIVPLGESYLELVTVVDADEAAASAFGRWVTAMLHGSAPALGWAARSDDLDALALRLRLDVATGSRTRPDGSVLTWRITGVAEAAADPSLPFLIAWGAGARLPGGTPVEHPAGPVRLVRLEVATDEGRWLAWTGGEVDGVRHVPGAGSTTRVVLQGDREIVLEA